MEASDEVGRLRAELRKAGTDAETVRAEAARAEQAAEAAAEAERAEVRRRRCAIGLKRVDRIVYVQQYILRACYLRCVVVAAHSL